MIASWCNIPSFFYVSFIIVLLISSKIGLAEQHQQQSSARELQAGTAPFSSRIGQSMKNQKSESKISSSTNNTDIENQNSESETGSSITTINMKNQNLESKIGSFITDTNIPGSEFNKICAFDNGIISCSLDSKCESDDDTIYWASARSRQINKRYSLNAMEDIINNYVPGENCVAHVAANISLNQVSEHIVVDACGIYASKDLRKVCATFEALPTLSDPTLTSCTSLTYGGQQCDCNVCKDGKGVNFTCAMYNENITSRGCQGYTFSDIDSFKKVLRGDVMNIYDESGNLVTGDTPRATFTSRVRSYLTIPETASYDRSTGANAQSLNALLLTFPVLVAIVFV